MPGLVPRVAPDLCEAKLTWVSGKFNQAGILKRCAGRNLDTFFENVDQDLWDNESG